MHRKSPACHWAFFGVHYRLLLSRSRVTPVDTAATQEKPGRHHLALASSLAFSGDSSRALGTPLYLIRQSLNRRMGQWLFVDLLSMVEAASQRERGGHDGEGNNNAHISTPYVACPMLGERTR